jgi:hypothetical protein
VLDGNRVFEGKVHDLLGTSLIVNPMGESPLDTLHAPSPALAAPGQAHTGSCP